MKRLTMYSINLPNSFSITVFGTLGESCLPFQHEYDMWMAANIWVDGHWKAEVVIFAIEIIKMIPPEIFYILRIYPAVTIGRLLDEHKWWQIICVPIRRDLNKASLGTFLERFHPMVWVFAVIDLGPFVASA